MGSDYFSDPGTALVRCGDGSMFAPAPTTWEATTFPASAYANMEVRVRVRYELS